LAAKLDIGEEQVKDNGLELFDNIMAAVVREDDNYYNNFILVI